MNKQNSSTINEFQKKQDQQNLKWISFKWKDSMVWFSCSLTCCQILRSSARQQPAQSNVLNFALRSGIFQHTQSVIDMTTMEGFRTLWNAQVSSAVGIICSGGKMNPYRPVSLSSMLKIKFDEGPQCRDIK